MATTTFSQAITALDTALAAQTIANGAYALSATAIDNRPTSGSVVSYDLADLRIPISSATPVTSGFIAVSILPAIDGGVVNYASPNAATAASPSLVAKTYQAVAAATTEIVVTDIPIGPYSFKVHILNSLGISITLPSVAQLQRRTMANW